MKTLEEVRAALLEPLRPLPTQVIPLQCAAGRILAESPRASGPVPPADTVSMDGFAVRAADLTEIPCSLTVVGRVTPGECFWGTVGFGQAVRVFTGAALPPGADAVVMQEDTSPGEAGANRVVICERVKPWENIRFRGEDVADGAGLLEPGGRLGPAQLALLAAAGVGEVTVRTLPRVGLVVTGSELVPPGQELRPGQIHESNGLMLAELFRSDGFEVQVFPSVPDHLPTLVAALERASAERDLLVTSGGASVGEPDLMRAAVGELGGTIFDGQVALKPGKPFFWAHLSGCPLLGVPGNPVSAFVTAVLLVLPALRRLAGRRSELPDTTIGFLAEPLVNGDSRRHFVRVAVSCAGEVRSAGQQASHRLRSLALANGLVEVPPRSTLDAGAQVKVIRWPGSSP